MQSIGIGAGLGIFFLIFVLIIIVLAILATIFWIWMLIDCATNDYIDKNNKILWIILIFFTHLIGAAVYYFAIRRPQHLEGIRS